MKNRIVVAVFVLTMMIGFSSVLAVDSFTKEQQAFLAVVKAYYNRGNYIDYDSIPMNYLGDYPVYGTDAVYMQRNYLVTQNVKSLPNNSKWLYSPEEATSQHRMYFVCSHFAYAVFSEAFENMKGEPYLLKGGNGELPQITKRMYQIANPGSELYNEKIAVDFIVRDENKIEENYQRILTEIEPGDILVTNSGTGGHAVVYAGEGFVYHSTGPGGGIAKYSIKKKMDESIKATVSKQTIEKWYEGAQKRKYISIIRPINEIKTGNYRISEKTLRRMEHPDLMAEKIASVETFDNVNVGETITYFIILQNKSKTDDYDGIVVTDKIPANTEFISMDSLGTSSKGSLSWKVNIPKSKKITLSYTVRVNNDESLIGKTITNNQTAVDGIKMNTITTTIHSVLSSSQIQEIQKLSSMAQKSYSSTEAFINSVYQGMDFKSAEKMLQMFFDIKNENLKLYSSSFGRNEGAKQVYHMKKMSNIQKSTPFYANMLVEGLWGGFYTVGETKETNDDGRATYFTEKTFMIGDILVLCDADYQSDTFVAGNQNMYLYFDESKFATVENGKLRIIEGEEAKRLIDSLIGQDCFIVLRPSHSMTEEWMQSIHSYMVGSNYYESLSEACLAIEKEGTIKVLNDVEDDSDVKIKQTQKIILDTNGKKLTLKTSYLKNYGNLTILGKGSMITNQAYLIQNNGKLVIREGSLINMGRSSGNWYTIWNLGGTVEINGGTIEAKAFKSSGNGRAIGNKNEFILSIKGGTIRSEEGYGITAISSKNGEANGKVTINGGNIVAKNGIIVSIEGDFTSNTSVVINAGKIEAKSNGIEFLEKTKGSLEMNGGTVISKEGIAINDQGDGAMILGKKDNQVVNETPLILGNTKGIDSRNGFGFYDGMIGGIEKSYDAKVNYMENNCQVDESTQSISGVTYQIAKLKSEMAEGQEVAPIISSIVKKSRELKVSPSNMTLNEGETATVAIHFEGEDIVEIHNSNKKVLSTSLSGNTLSLKANKVSNNTVVTITISVEESEEYDEDSISMKVKVLAPIVVTAQTQVPVIENVQEQISDMDDDMLDDLVVESDFEEEIKNTIKNQSKGGTTQNQKVEIIKKETNIHIENVSEWAIDEMNRAAERDLIPEYFDNYDFRYTISRTEFAAVSVKLYEAISGKTAIISAQNPFVDTNDEYVLKAHRLGITNGTSENTFSPEMTLTREQMATMLTRALNSAGINTSINLKNIKKFSDDKDMHDWGKPAIYFMSEKGIIKGMGENRYGVELNATREQAIVISLRSVKTFE